MGRIIEILKEFQNNSRVISLTYLITKFSLTLRTLQKDINRINSLLAEVSNCKVVKSKDQLILVGDDYEIVINDLLKKLLKFSNSSLIKSYQLLLYFIWENQPLSNTKLINLTNDSLYNLKQQLNLLNNFFQYFQLNLSLKFKAKKGWELVGCEQDLRILATSILINFNNIIDINNATDSNFYFLFFHLFNDLKRILTSSNIYHYYFHEIFYFLIIAIRRIKIDKLLDNYYYHFLLKQLIKNEVNINQHYLQLVNLLQKNFSLKINNYEVFYFKSLMLFNQKVLDSNLFMKLIFDLKSFINNLIFEKYRFLVVVKNFKLLLDNFLQENCLRFLFNFYKSFNFNDLTKNPFSIDDSYFYSWEILSIIIFAFKKFNIDVNFNLFINNSFLMNFDSLYLQKNQKDWMIPLYYQQNDNNFSKLNKIILFIKNKYPNIILKSLDINNDFYKINFLNKEYAILLNDNLTLDSLQLKKVFLVKTNCLNLNQYLQSNIDLTIKMIMFNKICSSILVLDFFIKQKFYSLETFLTFFQNLLIRKFKINYINFDLKNAFIYKKFFQKNILLVHKIVPINNIELPIILIFLKNPLFFYKNNPIYFIFIIITSSNTLYQYNWIILYLNFIKDKFNIKITSIKNLYKILSNSLPHQA